MVQQSRAYEKIRQWVERARTPSAKDRACIKRGPETGWHFQIVAGHLASDDPQAVVARCDEHHANQMTGRKRARHSLRLDDDGVLVIASLGIGLGHEVLHDRRGREVFQVECDLG